MPNTFRLQFARGPILQTILYVEPFEYIMSDSSRPLGGVGYREPVVTVVVVADLVLRVQIPVELLAVDRFLDRLAW